MLFTRMLQCLLFIFFCCLIAPTTAQDCSSSNPCSNPSHCCSQYGYCGTTHDYCGPGCQTGPCDIELGKCNASLPCYLPEYCCSQYDYCGTTVDYCGTGCQSGPCTGNPSATPSKSRTPSISRSKSITPSRSRTPTISLSKSKSPIITRTPSISQSKSITPSRSRTPTISLSKSKSPSITPSVSRTKSAAPSLTPSKSPSQSSKKVIAYYTNWGTTTVSQIPVSQLTHLNFAFIEIVNGLCTIPFNGNTRLTQISALPSSLKKLISLGGAGSGDAFTSTIASNQTILTFVNSCISIMQTYNFDGIDVDWEFPTETDTPGFVTLISKFRSQLDLQFPSSHKLLTIASASTNWFGQHFNVPTITPNIDWYNLMTYDYHGSWEPKTGHNSPLYYNPASGANDGTNINSTVDLYHSTYGVPLSKLVVGIPFYGLSYACTPSTSNGLFQTYNSSCEVTNYTYDQIVSTYTPANGYAAYLDSVSLVPWVYSSSAKKFISYDNAASVAAKGSYVKSKGLAGAMFWELSQNTDGTLLTSLVNSLN
eukprot:TRINITY_DN3454_c0_g1_i6.p1 TRINITY_DN3454_c0_g1~~TRINITY_DN3454_c0_g1_i6.p1  ORF type:complete len:537 (-),score=58.13 TRINITY_DN3454_c0_g1_i6:43-1653(-)